MDSIPLVMVHGLFGWGEARPLYGTFPDYFPLRRLREIWRRGPVVAPDVGTATSDHDRACEAFAQLTGLLTDYGQEHAERCGHPRFGPDFRGKALLRHWNAAHPVHLVGHSFGGNTIIALLGLLAEDHWGHGTSTDWVLSITTICSPLRGCSLVKAVTGGSVENGKFTIQLGSPSHILSMVLAVLLRAQVRWPLVFKGLYDLRSDQWGQQPLSWRQLWKAEHPYWLSGDNVVVGSSPEYNASEVRIRLKALSRVRLVAVIADGLAPVSPAAAARGLLLRAAGVLAALFALWRLRRLRLRGSLNALRELRLLLLPCAVAALSTAMALLGSEPTGGAPASFWRDMSERKWTVFHEWISRPMMRLLSHTLTRTASSFSDSSGQLATRCGFARGTNDGVIDIASQRWLDTPGTRGGSRWRGGMSRCVRSTQEELSARDETSVANSFSERDMASGASGRCDVQVLPEPGKWHAVHVPDADHALGTICSSHTAAMFRSVLQLLEALPRQR